MNDVAEVTRSMRSPQANLTPPPPPPHLAEYVGDRNRPDPVGSYLGAGRAMREEILLTLPDDWSWQDRRVLDFGCGSGRVLRHFLDEARSGEFYGCDIHAESIAWAKQHLSPPVRIFGSDERPPVSIRDGYLDLVWAMSVFTHLTDSWSAWLLEIHRILKPDGLFITTFMGEGMSEILADEPWDDTRIGMNVLGYGQGWDAGGPMVLHSPWWIEAHWGRAFEILQLRPTGFIGTGQGLVFMRKRDISLRADDLEELEPNEPREISALRHSVRQLQKESGALNQARDHYAELARIRNYPQRAKNVLRRALRWHRN